MRRERSFGLGCFRFYHAAITASILADEREQTATFAASLEAFVDGDVSPLTGLYLRWADVSVHDDEDSVYAVRDDAHRAGLDAIVRNIPSRTMRRA